MKIRFSVNNLIIIKYSRRNEENKNVNIIQSDKESFKMVTPSSQIYTVS
jgi:hypothetical protein